MSIVHADINFIFFGSSLSKKGRILLFSKSRDRILFILEGRIRIMVNSDLNP